MADIFREVDEDVRRDKAAELFSKYQNYFIALAVLVVAAVAAYRAYEHYRLQAAETAGAQYEAAVQLARAGKSAEAQSALEEIAKTGPAGYRTLALLRDAGVIAGRDPAAGLAAFDQLSRNAALPATFQDIARLRAAYLRLDEAGLAEMVNRLQPLTSEANAYRHSAREILALAALKANDLAAAGLWLDAIIVDPQSPAELRKRAEDFSGLVRSGTAAPAGQ